MSICSAVSYCNNYFPPVGTAMINHRQCDECGKRLGCFYEEWDKNCEECIPIIGARELRKKGYYICDDVFCKNAFYDANTKHNTLCRDCKHALVCSDMACKSQYCHQCCIKNNDNSCNNCGYINQDGCGLHRDQQNWKGVSPKLNCCYHCTPKDKAPCASCGRVLTNYTLGQSWNYAVCGRCHKKTTPNSY